jgi:hypothetical protein
MLLRSVSPELEATQSLVDVSPGCIVVAIDVDDFHERSPPHLTTDDEYGEATSDLTALHANH